MSTPRCNLHPCITPAPQPIPIPQDTKRPPPFPLSPSSPSLCDAAVAFGCPTSPPAGFPAMPPLWALGFHLCRWGYGSSNETWQTVRAMRNFQIPQVPPSPTEGGGMGSGGCRPPLSRFPAGCAVERHRLHGRVPRLHLRCPEIRLSPLTGGGSPQAQAALRYDLGTRLVSLMGLWPGCRAGTWGQLVAPSGLCRVLASTRAGDFYQSLQTADGNPL